MSLELYRFEQLFQFPRPRFPCLSNEGVEIMVSNSYSSSAILYTGSNSICSVQISAWDL